MAAGEWSEKVRKRTAKNGWLETPRTLFRANFWGGDATKHFSVKKGVFSEKGGGNSVNAGFGKDFYRKGNSVKRSGPFSEPPDSEK